MTPMTPPVTQKELVRQLSEVASLLELSGEAGFRINAYAAAARSLDAFAGDFAGLFAERRLTELRGIGKGLAAELYALAGRERLEVLDALYTQIPAGVRELLRVSGLGPKRARQLWQNGVTDLAELVAAAQDGRVAGIKGFGAKRAQALGAAAAFAQAAKARLRLDEAEVYALAFAAVLTEALPEAQLHWAGELRRSLETVGRLEAVVTGTLLERLQGALPLFCSAVQRTAEGVSVTFEGRPVVLYPVELDALGAVLAVRTGNDAFTAALQERAAEQGLKLTTAGLFGTGVPPETPTEAVVFGTLRLPYVPPERRDADLSEARTPPAEALVTVQDIRGLVHNHSNWSDGAASLREMVAAARALGYSYLAMADHSKTSSYAGGLSAERVAAQAREIATIRHELRADGSDFRVLHGLEVDIMPDGSLDYPDELLATLDYAVVSVHQHFTLSKSKQTERLVRAVHSPYASILGHLTGRLLLRRPGYEVDISAVLEACAATATVVEINANPRRLDLDWREVRRACELGCRFAINPDAHHPDGYRDVRYGVLMARKAGLEAARIVNTAPSAAAFLAQLKPKPRT